MKCLKVVAEMGDRDAADSARASKLGRSFMGTFKTPIFGWVFEVRISNNFQ